MDYFAMVAHERSFTRAAQRLHITQQTLSAHIAALEKELGCTLLLRRTPLELTYPGQVFLEYALAFQRRRRQLERDFADLAGEAKGCLRIGIGTVRGRSILPRVIQAYQKQWPQVEIRLFEGGGELFYDQLTRRELDLIIGHFSQTLPGVELLDLYREEVVLLISRALLEELYGPDWPQTAAQVRALESLEPLAGCPFVVNSEEDVVGSLRQFLFARLEVEPAIRVKSKNLGTLLDLCLRGVGACFCPELMARATLTQEQLGLLELFRFSRHACHTISIGFRKQERQWSVLSHFVELTRQMLGEEDFLP